MVVVAVIVLLEVLVGTILVKVVVVLEALLLCTVGC